MSSLYNLVRGAVDYAGLFPPAGLPLDEVVANYANYLECPERAMLGRLIIPALKLPEFEIAAEGFLPPAPEQPPWRISTALVPPIIESSGQFDTQKPDSALEAIESFNNKNRHRATVDAIEVGTPSAAILTKTIEKLPTGINAFLEIPHKSDPKELIQSLGQSKHGKSIFAKIRTGGVTPELIPSIPEVARFIATCAKHDVGFKATAGLHHPIRSAHHLTYDSDSPTATMHGFLNVFFGAVIAFEHKVDQDVVEQILANVSLSHFAFSNEKLAWGDLEVSADRVAQIRNNGIISFGSCSFIEPTEELQQIPADSYESVFAG